MSEKINTKTFNGLATKTKTFLSETRPIYTIDKRDDGELKVEPGEIRFESVEAGVLYIMTFSIRNNTKVAQRIRIQPPHTGFFALNYIPSGSVAPGLDIRAEIECQLPTDNSDLVFTDKVIATMGSYRIEIPIFACRPYANIKFNRTIDCGNIVLHQPLTVDMVFENIGVLPGQLKLTNSGPDSYIKSMTPPRFELDVKGTTKSINTVKVTIDAKEAGSWRELVRVSIAGTIDDALIEIHANFVEPKLTFLTENNQGLLETANFGTLFYGEAKSIKGLLVNAGPLPLNFATVYEDDEENEGGEVFSDEITAHHTKTLTIYPIDGIVKPFSQIPIVLTFKPKLYVPTKGFVRQHVDDNKVARQILRKVSIDCSDVEQRISVNMQGTAAAPMVTVSPSVLRFGDCPVNDRRDILINVSNKTKYPTDFEFPIIANFKFNPTKGHLHSLETVSVVASFLPPQLGKFKSAIKLSLAGGLGVFEVHAIGNADDSGTRKTLVGGTHLLPADFEKQRKFVNPEEEATARFEQQRALEFSAMQVQNGLRNALKTKLAGTSYVALPIGTKAPALTGNPANPLHNTAPGNMGDVTAALAHLDVNGNPAQGDDAIPADLMSNGSSQERDYMYGLTDQSVVRPLDPSHPMLQRREHNKAYNDFLQQSHALRQKKQIKQKHDMSLTKGAINFSDPFGVNMGMERGLEEPVLKVPIAGEPLWLANGAAEGEGAGPLRLPADENRLIVKKFGSTPATQAELRDCSAELSQENLKLVAGSHKLIEFGRVSVGSSVAKSFSVANDLTQAVMVKIEELDAELQQSKALCQIIPQGALAGFDIYFSSRHIGKVKKHFVWRINGIHVTKVVVTADVVPIELVMSTQELVMEFPNDSLAPTLSSNFVLQNPGNAPADFLWGSAGAFQCIPETGTINPGDSLVMTVTWSPLSGKRNEEELGLHITGGVDQTLKVQGILKETKAEFEQRRLNLGVMAVGTEKIVTATLRNTGTAPLVFFLNPLDERLGIRVSPHEAMIIPGEAATITVSVTPKAATTYDNISISAKIRGGKPVSIRLTGSSIIPELTLFEQAFNFGSVTIGAEHRLPFTITNKTSILTTMVLDLTQYPDFTPCIKGGAEDDQEAQLATVIGTVHDDQEDSFGNQIIRVKENNMINDGSSLESVKIMRKIKNVRKNTWNLLILPNATITGDLVFRPTVARQSGFKLPLFLQGIMEDKSYNRDVTASAQTSTLNVSEFVVDFGDRVVSRDPMSRISYFLETTIKNVANKRAVNFEIREMPEVIKEFGDVKEPSKPDPNALGMDDASKQIFFVAPTKGDLAPGSSMPIRVTFQPQSSANYSKKLEIYIKDQPDPTRPYLTLLCQGSGVFPRLTFSQQLVELPNVPLGITSRATFTLFNNGYNSLAIRHRISPNIPVSLDISYPDGQSVGIMVEKIRVVIAAKSETPISWSGKIEFYDQDGERFFVNVSGCTDGCLLTNYPFVRDYSSEYGFLGIDDQPVKYLRKSVIAELRQQEAKRKEEQRRLRSLQRKLAVEGKTEEKDPKGKKRSGSPTNAGKGSSLEEGSLTSKTSKGNKSSTSTVLQAPSTPAPLEPEGIDADRPPPNSFDDSELNFLMKWLNRNICRKPFEVDRFPDCVCDTNGDIVVDCIELMSGKKVPNVKPEDGEGGRQGGRGSTDMRGRGSDATADINIDRKKKGSEKVNRLTTANRLVYKYQQLLNFLVNNGALLSHINPVSLLGMEDHLLAQEFDLTRDKSQRFTPAMLSERRSAWQAQWLHGCKRTWLEVLYQSVKIFILARVHFKDFSTMPGVVLTNNQSDLPAPPAAKAKPAGPGPPGKAEPKKKVPPYPKDLAPSNVFTHAEAVLLQWASYHLDRANKLPDEGANGSGASDLSKLISFGKRVTDLDADFKDLIGYCQLIHSHVSDSTTHGRPLSGYTMMDRGKGEEAHPHFEEAMQELRMDLGTNYEDITYSTRSILLMVLHMYLNLPNLVPKTKVEFVGDLGTPIMKEIELKNPSRKTIEYSVTLSGNGDFTAQSTSLVIGPESSAVFLVTLNAKFVDPVHAKLTFWSQKDSGLSGSTMCFDLVSRITGRRPTETLKRDTHLFELEQFQVTVKSPFPKDATYQISLHISGLPTTIDDHLNTLALEAAGKRVKPPKAKEFKPILPLIAGVDVSILSPAERKQREEESELELTFRQPFWCNEESVPISKTSARTITVYCLPFTMGKYNCQVVFSEKETGEFCKEIVANVGLPKVSDKLEFSALRDNYISMAMRVASKNATFEKAFAILGDMRMKNVAKKTKARAIFQNLISSQVVNEETGQSNFLIDFLSQYFEYTKALPFVSEYMKFKNGDAPDAPAGPGAKPVKASNANKYKKMLRSLIEPISEETGAIDLNTTTLSFIPPKAGHYHSLAVVHSKDNAFDVRVIEVSANVAMPDAKMALEFSGPARQRVTQLIPVTNESKKDWNLLVTLQGKGFTCPKTLLVPAGQSANLEVSFFAVKAGKYAGQLLLRNTSGTENNDNFEYKLFGEADDALAEDDVKFEAIARKKKRFSIILPASAAPAAPVALSPAKKGAVDNDSVDGSIIANNRVFTVESDLPYVHFSEHFEVQPGETRSEFFFTVNSPIGGTFTGTINFTDETGALFWYTVAIEVAAPKEEKVIDVEATVRKAAVVEITLENPTEEDLVFDVNFQGDGLLGEDSIILPASTSKKAADGTGIYELIYSPLLAGEYTGRISFTNDYVGVLWYKLNLIALPAEPIVLDTIESMIGSSDFVVAPIDNPLAEPVTFSVIVADAEHFSVTPENIVLGPYAQSTFNINFRPSSLTEKVFSRVILQNAKFGEIQFAVSGVGLLPGIMPTVHIDAPLSEIGSQTIVFRNPFPHPLPLDVILTHADSPTDPRSLRNKKAIDAKLEEMQTAFGLLMRKTNDVVIAAKASYHIALSFNPEKMGIYEAVVQVRSVVGGRSLLWCYPISGMAESGVPQRLPTLKTACKTTMIKEFNISLDGIRRADLSAHEELTLSDFSVDIKADESVKSMVLRAFRAQPLEIVPAQNSDINGDVGQEHYGREPADFALRLRMLFEPLRTFIANVDISITCRNKGKWRVKLDLDATDPEPDDVIKLTAPVGSSDKVTFRLNNRFLGYSTFQAYYSAKSSPHFSVSPSTGTLAPYGAEGTPFVVTFAPIDYGTIEVGTLIIVTEDAQWSYEVRGAYPSNSINHANIKSKVDSFRPSPLYK